MFQTIEFPAGIADLATSLTNVNGDGLTHDGVEGRGVGLKNYDDEEQVQRRLQ